MRFAVGYYLPSSDKEPVIDIIKDYSDHIDEVYFPWVGSSSGRAALGVKRGGVDWTAQQTLERDLKELRDMGKRLDLLFNSNCYGGRAISEHLQNEVGSILDYLEMRGLLPEAVTTTSLTVARTVKKYFPDIDVRASVNMRIESPESMSYVSGLFDSYYVRRDNQRNIEYVKSVKKWCDENGKGLYMLANSGCLYQCPGQSFHDNMVAHDAEIDEQKNIKGWIPHVCWNLYKDESKRPAVLKTSWIRPEDIHYYEGLVPMMKLATRMHERPRAVIGAYTSGKYEGNLLDLFEPGHGPAFAPNIIDNTAFPEGWHERVSACARNCHECRYCETVFEHVYKAT